MVVDRGALPLSVPLMWIMGGIHIQIGLPRGPLTIPPDSAIQYFPKELYAFLSSVCYIFTYTGFVGHNQVITSLRAAYRMTDFHWILAGVEKVPMHRNVTISVI